MLSFTLRISLSVFISLIAFNFSVFSQSKDWKEISQFELQNITPKVQADASAEAIFWDVKIEQTNRSLTEETYVRLKIFNEKGVKDNTTLSIEYSDDYELNDFKARLMQVDGKIVELKKQDLISLDVAKFANSKIIKKSFVIPNLSIGSILEYKYELRRNPGINEWRLILQKNIPLQEITYFVKSEIANDSLKIMRFNVKDFEFKKTDNDFTMMRLKNVPAMKSEPNQMPVYNLFPWVFLYYDKENSVEPEKYWKNFAKSMGDWHFSLTESNDEIKKLAKQLTEGKENEEEKIASIFNYCRNEIQNYQYLDEADRQKVSAENWGNWQAKEVLKNKAGPDFGVNNLFVAVATAADLDVRIIYTGDRRSFVFANNKFAHRSLLIYSGIAVKTAKGWHYCYPSMKYTPANHLYWFSEGQDALLIGKKESEWVKLPIAPPEYNKSEQKANLKLLPDGTLEGTVKNTYYGFIGTDSKLGFKDLSEKYIKESIENIWKGRFDKFEIENVSINKSVWFNEPFEIQYKIKVFDYARSTEKRMIFQPGFFEYGIKPKFQDSTRFTPIYFDKSNWDLQEVEIEIPQNYETEALNLSRKVSEAGIVDFEVNIGFDPQRNTLKYRRNFKYGENGRLLYPVNSYPLLKNIFDRISLIDSDVITLKKKT